MIDAGVWAGLAKTNVKLKRLEVDEIGDNFTDFFIRHFTKDTI